MVIISILYVLYIVLYIAISYAIIYHLMKYRLPGDASGAVAISYVVLSLIIFGGTIAFLLTTK